MLGPTRISDMCVIVHGSCHNSANGVATMYTCGKNRVEIRVCVNDRYEKAAT